MVNTSQYKKHKPVTRFAHWRKILMTSLKTATLADKLYCGSVLLLFSSFLFQAILFASIVRQGVTPDENYHLSLIFLYRHLDGMLLQNTAASLFLGNVERIPFLYHLVMGKLLWLNPFPVSDYAFLKALSVAMSFGTIVFSWSAFRLATKHRHTQVLALGILTHLVGYTFLAGAIHPLVMLQFVTALQVYCLFHLIKKRTPVALAMFLFCFVLAPLISLAAFAINTVCLFILWFAWRSDIKIILKRIRLQSKAFVVALLLSLGFGFTGYFFGSNILEFGRVVPLCHQMMTFEQCIDGKFTYRNEVEQMMTRARTPFTLDFATYLPEWGNMMLQRVTGIAVQQKFCYERDANDACDLYRGQFFWHETELFADYRIESAIRILLVVVAAALGANLIRAIVNYNGRREREEPRFLFYSILLCLFFLISIVAINYGMYQGSGHLRFGIYGYNIFLILPLLSFVIASFLLRFVPNKLQPALVVAVVSVFVWSSFPSFLQHQKTGEIIASTPNIVPLIRCDESRGYCNAIPFPDRWSYCMPEKDWQCLADEIGADMIL